MFLRALGMATAVAIGVAPQAAQAEEKIVNVYNWANYIGEKTIENFEAETGIKVRYDLFDSVETLETKMLTGSTNYDVVFPSAALTERLVATKTPQKIDKSKLTNWRNLDPIILDRLAKHDPGNAYLVPYMWGTISINYNSAMVSKRLGDAPVNSLDLIFKPDIVSKIADCGIGTLDSGQEILGLALNYLGLDPYSLNKADVKKAADLVAKVRPNIRYFDSVRMLDDLANGEICIGLGYNGDASLASLFAAEAGKDNVILNSIPKEGSMIWFDGMAIPSDAPHIENAHKFINYILRPEVIAEATNYVFLANANSAATELVIDEVKGDPNIYPPADVISRLYPDLSIPHKGVKLRTREWTRIKTGN